MFRTKIGALLAVLAVVAIACSDASSSESAATPTNAATGTVTSTTAPPATAAPTTTVAEPSGFPVTIAAANGDIEIPARPGAIVSLSATHTEMLYAIGAGDQIVAVDSFSNYPPGAPVTDLTAFTPNVESIVELDADLVVLDGDWDGTSVATLTDLDVPVLVLPAATTFDDVYVQIERLGAATGNIADSAQLVGQMRADVDEILASLPPTETPLTFYHELDASYYSVTTETFIGQIYGLMGLENIADAVGEGAFGYPQLSEEYILEQNPDVIFLADTICCGVSLATIGERPGWGTLTAVQTGAVVELSDDIASRWGPRIVDYMRSVAEGLALVPANG